MNIKWDHLGEVALASFGITIAVVVLFSLGIAAWAQDSLIDSMIIPWRVSAVSGKRP